MFGARPGTTPERLIPDTGDPAAIVEAGWLEDLRSAGAAQASNHRNATTSWGTLPLQIGARVVPMHELAAWD